MMCGKDLMLRLEGLVRGGDRILQLHDNVVELQNLHFSLLFLCPLLVQRLPNVIRI